MATKPKTVDEYFKTLPKDVTDVLKKVRKTLKQNLPKQAEEIISYGIPAFKWHKTPLYYAGWSEHISIYPIPKGDAIFQKEIKPYIAGKGTLKFMLDEPLPIELIAKIAKVRVANDGIDYTPKKKSASTKSKKSSAKTK